MNASTHDRFNPARWLLVSGFAIIVFMAMYMTPNSQALGDSHLALLSAQALIEEQTWQLDSYLDQIGDMGSSYRVYPHDGHVFYTYPPGSTIVSLPVVWILLQLDYDMATWADDDMAQNLLSSLVGAIIFVLLFAMGRTLFDFKTSLLLAVPLAMGSSLMSVLGTAYWNLAPSLLFTFVALLLLMRYEFGSARTPHPYWLGASLFLAYISRPNSAILIALLLLYMLWQHRQYFLQVALTAFALFLLLVWQSTEIYGLWLPPIMVPGRLGDGEPALWQAVPTVLYGLLFGPARGFFTYSPIFLIPLVLLGPNRGKLSNRGLLAVAGVVILVNIVILTRFAQWWGGCTYGPRLMADTLPAFTLLTLLGWRTLTPRQKPWATAAWVMFGAISIFIHINGLTNPYAMQWGCGQQLLPYQHNYPQLLLDWQTPQFNANRENLCAVNERFHAHLLEDQRLVLQTYAAELVDASAASHGDLYAHTPYHFPDEDTIAALQNQPASQSSSYPGPTEPTPPPTLAPVVDMATVTPQLHFPVADVGLPRNGVSALLIGWSPYDEPQNMAWARCPMLQVQIGAIDRTIAAESYTLTLNLFAHFEHETTLTINDAVIETLSLRQGDQTVTRTIDSEVWRTDGPNRLTLTHPYLPTDPELFSLFPSATGFRSFQLTPDYHE